MTYESARTTDAAALALDYGERLIVGTARDVHSAIAKRVFKVTRFVAGRGPESFHDALVTSVYGVVSGGMRVSSGALRSLGAHGLGRPLEATERGRLMLAIVNGLIGDELRMLDDPQAIKIAIRMHGEDVPATPFPLKQAFPAATGHLVVLLHGVCESDESWTVPVTRITLVGHSMGGLVARAATNYGTAANRLWPKIVNDVMCLGTPHTGAALEKVAHLGSRVLRFWPISAPFGTILETRSDGIVDLRHGYISKDEWEGQDLTSQWGLDRIAAAPLAHAEYHFVASTIGATKHHPFSAVLGDLLVHFSSATGVGRTGPVVEGAHFEYVPSANHFTLLNHPQIGDWIVGWLNAKKRNTLVLAADPANR